MRSCKRRGGEGHSLCAFFRVLFSSRPLCVFDVSAGARLALLSTPRADQVYIPIAHFFFFKYRSSIFIDLFDLPAVCYLFVQLLGGRRACTPQQFLPRFVHEVDCIRRGRCR